MQIDMKKATFKEFVLYLGINQSMHGKTKLKNLWKVHEILLRIPSNITK
jgi:hypothetical protein